MDKRIRGVAFVWAFAALCAVAGAAEQDLPSLDEVVAGLPRYDLSGTVVDKDGAPIRRAEVFLYYQRNDRGLRNRLVGKTKTGRKGRFTFKNAVVWEPITERENQFGGRYAVIAKHEGHGLNFRLMIEEDRDESTNAYDNITIPLRGPVTYKAIVEDLDGNRLEGIRVYLCGTRLAEGDRVGVDRAKQYLRLNEDLGISWGVTDKWGRVELLGFEEGTYYWVEKEGCVRGWLPTTRDGRVATLHPSARISGTVALDDGTPAPGAAVWVEYNGNSCFWADVTVADEKGRYVIENAPAEDFTLARLDPSGAKGEPGADTVTAEDLRPGSTLMGKGVVIKTKRGEEKQADLKLLPGMILAGTVTHATTGEPMAAIQIDVHKTIPGKQYLDTQRIATDESGRFSVTVAPGSIIQLEYERSKDGSYIIDEEWKKRNRNGPAWKGVVTQSIEDMELEIMTWPVQPLTGRVVDASGKGVANATVWVHSEIPGITTDESGAFTLNVAPTDRDFDLFAVTESNTEAGLVHLKAGSTEATIPLESTQTFEGEVTNHAGLPANGLEFYMDLRLNESNIFRARREPKTDDDGRFTVENLYPKAAFHVWWSVDNDHNRDYSYGNADIDLAALKPGEPIRFQARQFLNALMGRVTDTDGNPIAGARVSVSDWSMMPQDGRRERVTTDETGQFTVPRLAFGEVPLTVSAEGFVGRRLRAASDAFDLEVTLRPDTEAPVYDLIVRDEAGKPVANAPVSARWIEALDGDAAWVVRECVTGEDGRAQVAFDFPKERRIARGVAVCDMPGHDLAIANLPAKVDAEIDLVARESGTPWACLVTDDKGEPVADAQVTVYAIRPADVSDVSCTAWFTEKSPLVFETDAEGRFTLDRLGRHYTLSMWINADRFARLECYLTEDSPESPVFALSPAGRVRARIVTEDGAAIPLDVLTGRLSGLGSHGRFEATDSGEYVAEGLAPGQYECVLVVRGDADEKYRSYVLKAFPEVSVAAAETSEVVFEFVRGTPIRGTFVDPATGKAPEGRKYVYARAKGGANCTAQVQDDGTWAIYVLPGTYEIRYNDGEGKLKTAQTIEVRKGKPVEGIAIELTPEQPKQD